VFRGPPRYSEPGLSWNTTSCTGFHSVDPLDNAAYTPSFTIFKGKTGTVLLNIESRPSLSYFGGGEVVETNEFNITFPSRQLFESVSLVFDPTNITLSPNQVVQVKMSLTVNPDATVTGNKEIPISITPETNGTISGFTVEYMFYVNFLNVPPNGTVYIRDDGTVQGTDKINREGNVYTLNGSIETPYGILIEKDNIVLDGKGYVLNGPGAIESSLTLTEGIDLAWRHNVTVTNMQLRGFDVGVSITNAFDNTILGCNISNNSYGVNVGLQSIGNHISGNNITTNAYHGVWVQSNNNTVLNNYVANNKGNGIYLSCSSSLFLVTGNTLTANILVNNQFGIYIDKIHGYDSPNNFVNNNILTANVVGIGIERSSNSVLRNNTMSKNEWNFKMDYSTYNNENINDIDESNTVNDKPIICWKGQQDRTVPSNAGYVFLLECKNITIQNLNLTNNQQAILLVSTQDSTIINNQISSNTFGIVLDSSINNKITANQITNNNCGIQLRWNSIHNTVAKNNLTKNVYGFQLDRADPSGTLYEEYDGRKNDIIENNIANNEVGIFFWPSSDNTIQQNNFIDNQKQVENNPNKPPLVNNWSDKNTGGNYWSDYNGTDANGDGIGDTPYKIDNANKDNYPLIRPYQMDLAIS
jgi:parallel beta-helix repeat protein